MTLNTLLAGSMLQLFFEGLAKKTSEVIFSSVYSQKRKNNKITVTRLIYPSKSNIQQIFLLSYNIP